MTKILFVCHGNICRSPMGEFIMKDIVEQAGRSDDFYIRSAAARTDEIGSPVYPPAAAKLREHGIDPSGKVARLLTRADYDEYDYIIGMDEENMRDMRRMFSDDSKVHKLLEFTGSSRDVSDPWYTRDFEKAYEDIYEGCLALAQQLGIN